MMMMETRFPSMDDGRAMQYDVWGSHARQVRATVLAELVVCEEASSLIGVVTTPIMELGR